MNFAGAPPTLLIVVGAALVAVLFTLAARAATRGPRRRLARASASPASPLLHRLHLRRAAAAPRAGLAGAAHRRSHRAAAPLHHRPGRRGRLPRAERRRSSSAATATPTSRPSPAAWRAARPASPSSRTAGSADLGKALARRGAKPPPRLGCVEAFNMMRGCPLDLLDLRHRPAARSTPGCKVDAERYRLLARRCRPRPRAPTPTPAAARICADLRLSRNLERARWTCAMPLASRFAPSQKGRPMADTAFNPENPPELIDRAVVQQPEPLTLKKLKGKVVVPRRLPDAVPRLAAPLAAAGASASRAPSTTMRSRSSACTWCSRTTRT